MSICKQAKHNYECSFLYFRSSGVFTATAVFHPTHPQPVVMIKQARSCETSHQIYEIYHDGDDGEEEPERTTIRRGEEEEVLGFQPTTLGGYV